MNFEDFAPQPSMRRVQPNPWNGTLEAQEVRRMGSGLKTRGAQVQMYGNSANYVRCNGKIVLAGQGMPLPMVGMSEGVPGTLSRSSSSSSLGSSGSVADKRTMPAPPKHNVMFHESRYKTEMCRQFEELGECEYGDRCLFAHGLFELKSLPHRHPKFKTEKCSAFHENGFCSFGPRCSFVHSRVDPVEVLEVIQQKMPKIPMPENPYPEAYRERSSSASSWGSYESSLSLASDVSMATVASNVGSGRGMKAEADQGRVPIGFSDRRLPIFEVICPSARSEK